MQATCKKSVLEYATETTHPATNQPQHAPPPKNEPHFEPYMVPEYRPSYANKIHLVGLDGAQE
jgi:hypothetical protein